MHIAHVVSTYPPYRGGMGNVAHEYATRLRARHHAVRVFTPRRAGLPVEDGVTALTPLMRVGNAALVPSVYRQLEGFDIVHLHYPFFGGAEPVLVRKRRHRAQALIVSYQMDATASGARGALFRLHQQTVLPRVVRSADRVLVSSRDYAASSDLAAIDGVLDRVEVHPPGVDLDRFHPGGEPSLRLALGIPPHLPVMLFVGSLDPAHHFKGLDILIDAVHDLRDLEWRLTIVGDGVLRPHFERRAEDRRLKDRIHFAGGVSDADLPKYYRAADVHVLPSTGAAEAFGLVAIEAAASGIPSVASDLPGVRTVVRHDKTGLLVRPGSAIVLAASLRSLLERPDQRKALGAAARRRAEDEFSWDPLITRLEHTYRDVLTTGA